MNAITKTSAGAVNVGILRTANEALAVSQKRISTGRFVLSAADDSARFRISSLQASRVRHIESTNNNVALALKTLEANTTTLKKLTATLEAALDITRRAQSEGLEDLRGNFSSSNISAASVIGGAAVGARLSITSDSGENFTYIVRSTADTWGDVAAALNASNVGVKADFIPSQTAGQTNIRFISTNGRDFHFDGSSDQGVMDDLASAGWGSPGSVQTMAGVMNAQALFGVGGVTGLGETGFTVSFGGNIIGAALVDLATIVDPGSQLVLRDGAGNVRSFIYDVPTTLETVMNDINTSGLAIRAEFSNHDSVGANQQFRLRSTDSSAIHIDHSAGDFILGGSVGIALANGTNSGYTPNLYADFKQRLYYGQQYSAMIASIDPIIQNNPVPRERNLLIGFNLGVVPDEFSEQPLLIQGMTLTSTGSLGLTQSGLTWGAFGNIQVSAVQVQQALDIVEAFEATLGTFASYLKARYDLAGETSRDLKSLSDEIVGADMAEESATMTALQARQQFAVQAFSMAERSDQDLLRLLS